ncbi:hypothetical protein AVEN_132033-1 [Araneus ventricosus]|uniref:Uncharacterized protein n=1 Tax=Araneus ventricosus TaxID=182803 RepID=A0A4Y2U7V6_ARAVE|nr:hypothetical protein AVEN_132033-1 [Araneus ventricosus]
MRSCVYHVTVKPRKLTPLPTQHTLRPRTSPYTYFTGGSGLQRRSRRRQSTRKGRSQKIECPPKFILSTAPRCPSREVAHISERADEGGFTDTGHGMEARLRFKGTFSWDFAQEGLSRMLK